MSNARSLAFAVLVLLFSSPAWAQYDAHWVTGNSGGGMVVDFRTSPPTITCGTAEMQALEGTATWSDALTGDLVVYSNGIEARTPTGLLAEGTGLNGNATATETALFVPVPGTNAQRLFIFSNNLSEVYYSIIDVPSKSILSDSQQKNQLVAMGTGEGMGAAAHANGIDFWLVVINTTTDSIDSFLITGDPAADSDPVPFPSQPTVSTPFSLLQSMTATNRASVVFSPDRGKLVIPIENNLGIWVFDFDTATGVPSGEEKILDGTGYSAAFSPDGNMVYFAATPGGLGYQGDVQQHNLTSEETTPLTTDLGWAGVALGPDDKIYVTGLDKTAFTVIDNPNVGGVSNVSTLTLPTPCKGGYNLSKQINLAGTDLIPCRDSGVGQQDTGCTEAMPVCEGSGLSASCVACEDNVAAAGQDFGCSAEAPICNPTTATCIALPDGGLDAGLDDFGTADSSTTNNTTGDDGGCCRVGADEGPDAGGALLAMLLVALHAVRRKRIGRRRSRSLGRSERPPRSSRA